MVGDDRDTLNRLEERANGIRRRVMMTLGAAGSGHVGGAFSAADLLTALYFSAMRTDPADPRHPDRDRLVLSKGHASVALCSVLADAGFFPVELLATFNQLDSPFAMHPDMAKIPGVDMSTGALGHGLSVAVGMALAGRVQGRAYRTYCLLGDGEICEGSVWEAAMAASHYGLDRLVAIVDHNGLSLDGPLETVMNPAPLPDKWRAFGWDVAEIDGHDMGQIVAALASAPLSPGRPSAVIARTVKGKGVSFFEGRAEWHSNTVDRATVERALAELGQGGRS